MASRKVLKKNVNYIAGELFAECLMNSLYVPGTDKKKADKQIPVGSMWCCTDDAFVIVGHCYIRFPP